MTRTNRSARQAGARFERQVADYLAAHLDDRIDRRVKTGAKDRGDIGGVRTFRGGRVVIECKDAGGKVKCPGCGHETRRADLGTWTREAEVERGNDDAVAGVVVHKKRGTALIGAQYVTMTVDDLVALLDGVRPSTAE
jgi:hypothetical protein